ncbi:MAG: beta-propeller fold lactonase family protein [Acidobacteriota bacterium]
MNSSRGPQSRLNRSSLFVRLALVCALFALPATGGFLTFLGAYFDGGGVPDGLDGASAVSVSPDGRHVYATGRLDDALVVFRRDATNDLLTYVETLQDGIGGVFGLNGAFDVTTSPDGRHVYAVSRNSDALTVFRRDPSGDNLAFVGAQENAVGGVFGLDGPSAVTVSPDGRHVYVTGERDDALVIFRRDPSNDSLFFYNLIEDNGVLGLGNPTSVDVSPDDLHVYVTAADSLSTFARDATTDALSHVGTIGANNDLEGARSVVTSPDGEHIYVAVEDLDTIAVFERTASGLPSRIATVENGVDGVSGLNAPTSIEFSLDGRVVFVSGRAARAVVVFQRDPASGALIYRKQLNLDDSGVTGTEGVIDLAASSDGEHLFAAGRAADSVVMFEQSLLFTDGFESGDTSRWSDTED